MRLPLNIMVGVLVLAAGAAGDVRGQVGVEGLGEVLARARVAAANANPAEFWGICDELIGRAGESVPVLERMMASARAEERGLAMQVVDSMADREWKGPGWPLKGMAPTLLRHTKDEEGFTRATAIRLLWKIEPEVTEVDGYALLKAALADAHWAVRQEATRGLGRQPWSAELERIVLAEAKEGSWIALDRLPGIAPDSREAVSWLREMLAKREHVGQVCKALARYRVVAAIPEMVAIVKADERADEVVRALGDFGPAAKEALPALMEITRADGQASMPHVCIDALEAIGDPAAVDVLLEFAVKRDWYAVRALRAFPQSGERGVETVLGLLKDDDKQLRRCAAMALGGIGQRNERVLQGLEAALKDKEVDVQVEAAMSLLQLNALSPEAERVLDQHWQQNSYALGKIGGTNRRFVQKVAGWLGTGNLRERALAGTIVLGMERVPVELRGAILAALEDRDVEVRWRVPVMLVRLPMDEEIERTLRRLSEDESNMVREGVVGALRKLKGTKREGFAREILQKMEKDAHPVVRTGARRAARMG